MLLNEMKLMGIHLHLLQTSQKPVWLFFKDNEKNGIKEKKCTLKWILLQFSLL